MERISRQILRILTGWFLVISFNDPPFAKARRKICQTCDERVLFVCGSCFCPLIAKSRLEDEECPLNKWPMTKEEISQLMRSRPMDRTFNKKIWEKAFMEYNSDDANIKKLDVHCVPCYAKVYFYIKKKYQA